MKKKYFYGIAGGIFVLAVFLRFFQLGNWMHYELDQSRDFRIVKAAIDRGIGELPLQGPKAAGNVLIADKNGELTDKTTLRLGPLFYYMEYISARIFGVTPLGSIIIIVLLSIATVPLFYIFVRRFFDIRIALGLTAIVASSLFFVTYSRFGWNPNLMPFFMTLLAYSLLRVTDTGSTQRNRGLWLIVSAVALAFVGQMHFLAFTSAPVITIVYLLWSQKQLRGESKIALKFWLGATAVFIFLQTPLIINDIKTEGENTRAFFAALTQKTEDENPKSLPEKVVRNIGNHAKYYWIIVTGDQRAELPTVRHRDIRCDHTCRAGLTRGAVALLSMIAGLMAWLVMYRREKDQKRRDFLRIVALWSGIVFVVYIPLAYDMAPRFFLLHGITVVIFLGLIVQAGFERGRRHDYVLGYLILGLAVISNISFVAQDFAQRARAIGDVALRIETDYIMKEKTRITFEQTASIMEYIMKRHKETGFPVWLHAQPEFKRAFWERIDTAGIPRFGAPAELTKAYKNGLYFLVVRTQSRQDSYTEKLQKNADMRTKKEFGTLVLYEFVPHQDVIIADDPTVHVERKDPQFSSNAQVRYLWRQIFEE